jgi:erythromycin esterase
MASEDDGNPRDTEAPDSSPRPEPAPPPLDEPPAEPDPKEENRLSKQVPLSLLFVAAGGAILVFLALVGIIGYFALSPKGGSPASSAKAAPADAVAVWGTVTRPDGEPARGALVALIPHFELEYPGDPPDVPTALTDARGAFRFATAPAGRYGVTATLAGSAAAYGGAHDVKPGASLRVDLKLGAQSFEVTGTVRDSSGAPVSEARIQAARFSPDEGDVFVVMTDANGRYSMSLPGGLDFVIVADAPPRTRVYRQISPSAQTVDLQLGPVPPPRPSDAEIAQALATGAIPIATLEPGSALTDLAPLKTLIGDARIVAIGEATHGSREFFLLRHRLLELLVTEMGFTVLAIEAGWSDTTRLDEHVTTGKGDLLGALSDLYYWAPNTEETVAVAQWMRRYNEDFSHKKKLRFLGFDIEFTPHAVAAVLAYLGKVDPAGAKGATELLAPLRDVSAENTYAQLDKAVLEKTARGLADLVARFDSERAAWVARADEASWTNARHHAELLQKTEALYRTPDGRTGRDAAMADNVDWILEHEPPGTRMILWAHNAHVATTALENSEMGQRLRARHGKDYFVLGVTFGSGALNAYDWSNGKPAGASKVVAVSVGAPPAGSLEAALGLAHKPIFALDLRATSGPFGAWLESKISTRHVGGIFHGEANAGKRVAPKASYDALVYIEKVTASHLHPNAR